MLVGVGFMGKVEVTNKDSITGDGSCPSLVREDSSFLYAVASECENDDAERFSGTLFATVDYSLKSDQPGRSSARPPGGRKLT